MNAYRLASTGLISLLLFLSLPASAESGFYFGAGLGSATLKDDFDGLQIDTDATAFQLAAGWRFSEFFSAELGYQDFGDFQQTVDVNGTPSVASLTADGFTLGIGGALPLSDRFSLTGRLGSFFWDGDAEINNVSQASPEDTNLFYGAGASFKLTPGFHLTGNWTRFELEDTQSDVFALGFQYHFGR